MLKSRNLRIVSLTIALLAVATMITSPAYAATPRSKGIAFVTTARALDLVRVERPDLYYRLLVHRSGKAVRVTAAERIYLGNVNRRAVRVANAASRMEFSSVSNKARSAYAQTTTVVVTPKAKAAEPVAQPDPWKRWKDLFAAIATGAAPLTPLFPIAGFISAVAIVIQLIIVAIESVAKAWAAAAALRMPR